MIVFVFQKGPYENFTDEGKKFTDKDTYERMKQVETEINDARRNLIENNDLVTEIVGDEESDIVDEIIDAELHQDVPEQLSIPVELREDDINEIDDCVERNIQLEEFEEVEDESADKENVPSVSKRKQRSCKEEGEIKRKYKKYSGVK